MDKAQPIWARMDGEPNLWFDRFTRFRLLGANRSIAEVYRQEHAAKQTKAKHPSPGWYEAAQRWQWQHRAEAWDATQREADEVTFLNDKVKAKENRQKIIRALESLAAFYINDLNERNKPAPNGKRRKSTVWHFARLTDATARIMAESRLEFGEPTDIQGHIGGAPLAGIDLSGLTIEQLEALAKSLKE